MKKKKKPPFKLPFLKLVKNSTLPYLRFLGKNVCMFCLQDHKSFFLKENSLTINNTNDASLTGKHLMTLKSSRGTDICNQNETCITYFFLFQSIFLIAMLFLFWIIPYCLIHYFRTFRLSEFTYRQRSRSCRCSWIEIYVEIGFCLLKEA